MYKLCFAFVIATISIACRQKGTEKENHLNRAAKTTILQTDKLKRPEGALLWTRASTVDAIRLPGKLTSYLAPDHIPLDTASGDANDDGVTDFLLITCIRNEDEFRHAAKLVQRELLLFLGYSDGSYQLTCRTRNAIPSINGGGQGDPFGGISVDKGQVSITDYFASNCKLISKYNFAYSKERNNWFLDNIIHESFCFDYQEYTRDTAIMRKFRRVALNRFDIEAENN